MTTDTYLIDISTDNLVEEFPALNVDTIKTATHALFSQQSEAQKTATHLLKDNVRYPGKDPAPNSTNELEKKFKAS